MTMFQPRAQGVFDQNPGRVFTGAETELIEEHRDYLRVVHFDQNRSGLPDVVAPWAANNTLGGVLWLRELGFAKLALLSRGSPLIDHWAAIKRERDIPVQTLAWEVSEGEFSRRALNWESNFYRHVMTSEQDRHGHCAA